VLDTPERLISSIIERDCGQRITDVTQMVTAITLDSEAGAALRMPPGSAGLQIIRHYKNLKNEILSISETVYGEGHINLVTPAASEATLRRNPSAATRRPVHNPIGSNRAMLLSYEGSLQLGLAGALVLLLQSQPFRGPSCTTKSLRLGVDFSAISWSRLPGAVGNRASHQFHPADRVVASGGQSPPATSVLAKYVPKPRKSFSGASAQVTPTHRNGAGVLSRWEDCSHLRERLR
jgi:hypothetical protein